MDGYRSAAETGKPWEVVVAGPRRDRYAFHVDHREGAFVVTRSVYGFPLARRVYRIDEVEGLEVAWGALREILPSPRGHQERGARFELLLRDGSRVPLSKRYQRGRFHDDAATAVEAALARDPAPRAHPTRAPRPVAIAILDGMEAASGLLSRPSAPFVLVVLIGLGVFAVQVVVERRSMGPVVFEGLQRCRYGGHEYLPGHTATFTLEPGAYSYEVWDPTAPNQWRIHTFRAEIGKTTRIKCGGRLAPR